MSIITVSRGTFGGGVKLAEQLAAMLGYRCLSREAVAEKASAPGVSQEQLLDALSKPPGFLERFQHKRYQFIALFEAALAEEIKAGGVIYHCNAGHLMLRSISPLFKVRVIAPVEKRVAMVRESRGMSVGEAAAYIQKVDAERKNWTRFLYGVDWEDPALYDTVVNVGTMNVSEACEMVAAGARQNCFAFIGDWRAQLEDFAMGCRVRAALAICPSTSHLEFEANSRQGRVSIRGRVSTVEEYEDVQRVVLGVPGVVAADLGEVWLPAHA